MQPSKRIQLVVLLLAGLWSGGILVAPLLGAGGSPFGSLLYSFYAPVCHQLDHRSFHLDGEKLAVCVRCSAIYFSFFVSTLAFVMLRRTFTHAVPTKPWILLALAPIAADAILSLLTGYESTTASRVATGALFGLMMPWYVVPLLTEGVSQLRTRFTIKEGSSYARETQ